MATALNPQQIELLVQQFMDQGMTHEQAYARMLELLGQSAGSAPGSPGATGPLSFLPPFPGKDALTGAEGSLIGGARNMLGGAMDALAQDPSLGLGPALLGGGGGQPEVVSPEAPAGAGRQQLTPEQMQQIAEMEARAKAAQGQPSDAMWSIPGGLGVGTNMDQGRMFGGEGNMMALGNMAQGTMGTQGSAMLPSQGMGGGGTYDQLLQTIMQQLQNPHQQMWKEYGGYDRGDTGEGSGDWKWSPEGIFKLMGMLPGFGSEVGGERRAQQGFETGQELMQAAGERPTDPGVKRQMELTMGRFDYPDQGAGTGQYGRMSSSDYKALSDGAEEVHGLLLGIKDPNNIDANTRLDIVAALRPLVQRFGPDVVSEYVGFDVSVIMTGGGGAYSTDTSGMSSAAQSLSQELGIQF